MLAHKEISHEVRPVLKTLFSVGLPRTMCAYFVCILSVLYTMSVLMLHRESFSSSAIAPCHVPISQSVAHASESKGCACVTRTWLQFATERKKNEAVISTRAIPLESPCNYSPSRYCGHPKKLYCITMQQPARRVWGFSHIPIDS